MSETGQNSSFYVNGNNYSTATATSNDSENVPNGNSAAPSSFYNTNGQQYQESNPTETAQYLTEAQAAATAAASSAAAASSSATTATTEASTATTEAGIATTQATAASGSASNAYTNATAAAGSATNAFTNATSAASSASSASTSAATATSEATTATTQATNAASSATAASTSATNAASSASAAASSASSAAAAVQAAAGTATPLIDGTAAVGTSTQWARQDHKHPTDTTRAPLASPALTGTPTAPTPTAGNSSTDIATTAFVATSFAPLASPALTGTPTAPTATTGDNTTKIATTAFVIANAGAATYGSSSPNMDGTASAGSAASASRSDHTHPTDTSRAPLASPALTGTPTAPTPTAGDNSTKIATTAYVEAAVPRKLLATYTASNSASISDTTTFAAWAAVYSRFEIRLTNILPVAAGSNLELLVHSGGAFQSSGYLAEYRYTLNGGTIGTGANSAQIYLQTSSQYSAGVGVCGDITVANPQSTTALKPWQGEFLGNSTTGMIWLSVDGYYNSTAAIDGFEILFTATNIASGTIEIFGII